MSNHVLIERTTKIKKPYIHTMFILKKVMNLTSYSWSTIIHFNNYKYIQI